MPRQISPELGQNSHVTEHKLVFMLGEELKKPLTAIKLLSESNADGNKINLEAQKALRTVDNILLFQQISENQLSLVPEPVHVGSTITDVVHNLRPLSIEFGCETEVIIQHGITTIDVDKNVLRSSIESLWQAVLSMTEKPSPLVCHVYKTNQGIKLALVNNSIDFSKVTLSRTRKNAGVSGSLSRVLPDLQRTS
jgi:K+-sensing histidine kinase KdpD